MKRLSASCGPGWGRSLACASPLMPKASREKHVGAASSAFPADSRIRLGVGVWARYSESGGPCQRQGEERDGNCRTVPARRRSAAPPSNGAGSLLLVAAGFLSSVTFECVTPFAAFAALAAATMPLPRALAMTAAIWLANQALGFLGARLSTRRRRLLPGAVRSVLQRFLPPLPRQRSSSGPTWCPLAKGPRRLRRSLRRL